MSEQDVRDLYRQLQRELITKIIVAIVSGLFIMIIGGGVAMAKIYNVKGKADKEYVDKFYGDMMRIMENRTLVLEEMVKAEKNRNQEKLDRLQFRLDELDKKWGEHMKYHLEKTRAAPTNSPITYFGENIDFLFNKK